MSSAGSRRAAGPKKRSFPPRKPALNAKQKYRDLLRRLPIGIYRTTPSGRFLAANPALVRMLGYKTEAELRDVRIPDLYVRNLERQTHLKKLEHDPTVTADLKLKRKDGRAIWVHDYPHAKNGPGGRILYFDGILAEVTREKKREHRLKKALAKLNKYRREREDLVKKLAESSITDDLTGIYNRRGFFTVGREFLALAERKKANMFLLFLDMDGLKRINDTFGHHVGDQALRTTAELMNRTFRNSDIKGRMGGDEFAVFPIDSSMAGVEAALERLQKNLQAFNKAPGATFQLSLSWGVSAYDPEHPVTIEELLIRADKLMYEHKNAKRRA